MSRNMFGEELFHNQESEPCETMRREDRWLLYVIGAAVLLVVAFGIFFA